MVGNLQEFDYGKEEWLQYEEWLQHFFDANKVTEDERKRAVFCPC